MSEIKKEKPRIPDRVMAEAVYQAGGSYREAARILKTSYSVVLQRSKKCMEIVRAKEDAMMEGVGLYRAKRGLIQDYIGISEDIIYDELLQGNVNVAKYVLDRLGKDLWNTKPPETQAEPEEELEVIGQYPDEVEDGEN